MTHKFSIGSALAATLLAAAPRGGEASGLHMPDPGPVVDAASARTILRLSSPAASSSASDFATVAGRRSLAQASSIFFNLETDLTRALDGGLDAVPDVPLSPLRVAYSITNNVPVSDEKDAYIRDQLMPALGALLGRSVRVRRPSGPLDFSSVTRTDVFGRRFPTPADGIDADILMSVVVSEPGDALGACDAGTVAAAAPAAFEAGTGRPVAGFIIICTLRGLKASDLSTLVHEMFHALVAHPQLVSQFVGFSTPPVATVDGTLFITSPMVQNFTADFFGCDTIVGARSEDGNSDAGIDQGTAGVGHWEQAVFYQDFLQGQVAGSSDSFDIARITDVSFSWLQDSGWYDVKYGSSGFPTVGHSEGCSWAAGDEDGVLADPATAPLVCSQADVDRCGVDSCVLPLQGFPFTSDDPLNDCLAGLPANCARCLADASGIGFCRNSALDSGFIFPRPVQDPSALFQIASTFSVASETKRVAGSSRDCRELGGDMRCVEEFDDDGNIVPACREMSCTDDGELLINGEPCDPSTANCPDEVKLCQDLGTLTCAEKDDCNRQGQCVQGNCFCYIGFGGPSCEIDICTDLGCPDGSACPDSGFCDLQTCGDWSVGSDDMGTPCNLPGDPAADVANLSSANNPEESAISPVTETAAAAPVSSAAAAAAAIASLVAVVAW